MGKNWKWAGGWNGERDTGKSTPVAACVTFIDPEFVHRHPTPPTPSRASRTNDSVIRVGKPTGAIWCEGGGSPPAGYKKTAIHRDKTSNLNQKLNTNMNRTFLLVLLLAFIAMFAGVDAGCCSCGGNPSCAQNCCAATYPSSCSYICRRATSPSCEVQCRSARRAQCC